MMQQPFHHSRLCWVCLTVLLTMALAARVEAADVAIIGNWYEQIGPDDLILGAGSDFRSTFETGATGATLGIANTQGAPWTLWVKRDTSCWPAAVSLAVRRTSDGTGAGSVSGGTDYLIIQDYEQSLFQGVGDRSGIGLQLRLVGISVQQGAGQHACLLTYRVQ